MKYFVLGAMPFGYGPASKAVAVAERLKSAGASCKFVGNSVSLELASRSYAFDDILDAETTPHLVQPFIREAQHCISVMDEDFALSALNENRTLSVIDSLFWMWNNIPKQYLHADNYFVQEFPGVRTRCKEINNTPSVVGPIIGCSKNEREESKNITINVGGFSSPFSDSVSSMKYLLLINTIIDGISEEKTDDMNNINVIGGKYAISHLKKLRSNNKNNYESVSPKESRSIFSNSFLVITSPGLTSTLECFSNNVPTLFLPPQNYSQWLTLNILRDQELAPYSTHWADYCGGSRIRERMPEDYAVRKINEIIEQFASQPRIRREAVAKLISGLRGGLTQLTDLQHGFFKRLGTNGAEKISANLLKTVGDGTLFYLSRKAIAR